MELDGKHNTGDYNPEVDVLLSRIREAEDLNTLRQLLFEVFLTDFGEENCGNRTLRGRCLGDLEGLRAPPCAVKRTPTQSSDFHSYILAGPQRTGGRSSSVSCCLQGAIDASDQTGASLPSWAFKAVLARFWLARV